SERSLHPNLVFIVSTQLVRACKNSYECLCEHRNYHTIGVRKIKLCERHRRNFALYFGSEGCFYFINLPDCQNLSFLESSHNICSRNSLTKMFPRTLVVITF